MNGCCVDKRCTEATCMDLPKEATCSDCKHMRHCQAFGFSTPEATSCDFFPRRFLPVADRVVTS